MISCDDECERRNDENWNVDYDCGWTKLWRLAFQELALR